jgi:hypothetical protein
MFERCRMLAGERRDSAHVDERMAVAMVDLRDALERGDTDLAIERALPSLDVPTTGHESREQVYSLAVEAALMGGKTEAFDELIAYVDHMQPAQATPLLRAGRERLRAEQAEHSGDRSAADALEREATDMLRSVGARPLLALALLERHRRRGDEEALAEARAIYADLGATSWLARIDEPSGLAA